MVNALPPEELKRLFLTIVPERYFDAKLDDLAVGLRKNLTIETDTGVLLWGAAGVGKTYAMVALAKTHIMSGYRVQRIHYEQLCLMLRDTFNPKATQTEWAIIEPMLNCDRLYIEDVGTTKSIGNMESDFSLRTFLVVIDMRMEHRRPTYITSNKSAENLGNSFDERIFDRLRTFKVIKMSGESKRREL